MRFPNLRRTATTAVLAAALAAPAGASAMSAATDTSTGTLHVIGNGRAFVRPDMANVGITVLQEKATRELARGRADLVANRIIAGLQGLGISRPDIQTSSISLSSNTIGRRHHRHTVWDAEIDLTINTDQVNLLSGLFAIASRDGASSFQGPNFGFSNPSAGLPEATTAAINDARTRADAAVAALGEQVIGVQSVDLDPNVGVLQPPQSLSSPGASAGPGKPVVPTPVLPGLQEVDASVDIVYLIGTQ
jgi:uncharacterized protein YggE